MPDTNELSIPLSVAQRLAKAGTLDLLAGLVEKATTDAYARGACDVITELLRRLDSIHEDVLNGDVTDPKSVISTLSDWAKYHDHAPE